MERFLLAAGAGAAAAAAAAAAAVPELDREQSAVEQALLGLSGAAESVRNVKEGRAERAEPKSVDELAGLGFQVRRVVCPQGHWLSLLPHNEEYECDLCGIDLPRYHADLVCVSCDYSLCRECAWMVEDWGKGVERQ